MLLSRNAALKSRLFCCHLMVVCFVVHISQSKMTKILWETTSSLHTTDRVAGHSAIETLKRWYVAHYLRWNGNDNRKKCLLSIRCGGWLFELTQNDVNMCGCVCIIIGHRWMNRVYANPANEPNYQIEFVDLRARIDNSLRCLRNTISP